MRKLSLILVIVLISITCTAQDIHFTMFQAAPTVLNPASAGVFDGTFRASVNYKTQWGSISNAFNTYSFTGEGALFKSRNRNAYMGVALSAYQDVAGSTNFGTSKINLSLSSVLYFDPYNTVSIGLTGGWAQRSISPGDLQWDAQFNGQIFDPSMPSYENYQFDNSDYFDFAAGAMWAYGTAASNIASHDKIKAQAGFAYHHLARPELVSYFGAADKLYSRFVIHASMQYSSGYSKLAFKPRISAFFQGPSREINVGCMFRYLLKDGSKYTGNIKGFAMALGGYYRVGDAISPSIEIELAGFSLGYSYDFNISKLRTASNGLGGSEIYLKFQNPNPFLRFSRRPSIR